MIRSKVNASLNQLSPLMKSVIVRKKTQRSYDATTDTMNEVLDEYPARVLIYRDESKGLTKVPVEFDYKVGDELKIGDKYLYISNVRNKADSVVVLTLEKTK